MNSDKKEMIKVAYDKAADVYTDRCFLELYDKPIDRKFYDLFFERVTNRGKVLEVGCGPGEVANYLRMKGIDIIGLDISEEMVRNARKLNSRIPFQVGDVFCMNFTDNSFAGVVAPYLIVNFGISDVEKAIKEIHRVLMPDGCLLMSFHIGHDLDVENPDFFIKGNKIKYSFFDPEAIRKIVLSANFTIDEYILRSPYEGEITTRCYIFARKTK